MVDFLTPKMEMSEEFICKIAADSTGSFPDDENSGGGGQLEANKGELPEEGEITDEDEDVPSGGGTGPSAVTSSQQSNRSTSSKSGGKSHAHSSRSSSYKKSNCISFNFLIFSTF